MADKFFIPGKIIMGEDALVAGMKQMKSMGDKALIVCGPIVKRIGLTKKITDMLEEEKIEYTVFPGITGEPTDTMIDEGVKAYQENKCDFFIGVGGGSPLDAIKAIAVMVTCGGKMSDYMGVPITQELPKMVAIPTTAGTGSEATQFTIITDTKTDVKMLLKGETLMPDLAIIEAELTMTAPKAVTAATGLDALTHAIEAYTSRKAQPLTDMFALSAIKRIFAYLPAAYLDGTNEKARSEMAMAALEAGIAFNNSSVTIVHGMSRPIGALFHVPHGVSNALLLYDCMEYVLEGVLKRFSILGKAIKVASEKEEDTVAAQKFLRAIKDICKTCEIGGIKEYGVDKERFIELVPKMAKDAMISGSPGNTRMEIDEKDIIEIYRKLV
ncbi:MAG: iron-containing alcohol dehydrogenase [Anaerostipes sp.]|nr:iron-containing alcohol dehydrogenase [Anaerostipes sp.]